MSSSAINTGLDRGFDAVPGALPSNDPTSNSRDTAAEAAREKSLFGPDGLTFHSLLETINPLQHIPIIGSIYRSLTGDTLEPGPRLAGGALFGGPIGFVTAAVNAIVQDITGKDINDQVASLFGVTPAAGAAPATLVAAAETIPPAAAPNAAAQPVLVAEAVLPSSPARVPDAAAEIASPVADSAKPVQLAAAEPDRQAAPVARANRPVTFVNGAAAQPASFATASAKPAVWFPANTVNRVPVSTSVTPGSPAALFAAGYSGKNLALPIGGIGKDGGGDDASSRAIAQRALAAYQKYIDMGTPHLNTVDQQN